MDISLDLVIEAARRRLAAITPESAGYIVLLTTQQLIEQPCRVLPADVLLQEDGEVRVRSLPRASEREVEGALRTLLATLLALSPSPVPAVSAVVGRDVGAGLRALASELSAALIPINHAAARRALARLYRETRRAGGLGAPPEPAAREPVAVAATERMAASAALVEPPRSEPTPAPASATVPIVSPAWPDIDIDIDVEREAAPVERVAALPVPPALDLRDPGLTSIAPRSSSPSSEAGPEAHPSSSPTIEAGSREAHPSSAAAEHGGRAGSGSAPPPGLSGGDPRSATCRSNVRELLASYLSQTRAEEPMARALREMIGLAAAPPGSDAPPSPPDAKTVSR